MKFDSDVMDVSEQFESREEGRMESFGCWMEREVNCWRPRPALGVIVAETGLCRECRSLMMMMMSIALLRGRTV